MDIITLENLIRPLNWTVCGRNRDTPACGCARCYPKGYKGSPGASILFTEWRPHIHALSKCQRGAWRVDELAGMLHTLGVECVWSKNERKTMWVTIKDKPLNP
jgi:hypothetical protein